MAKIAKKSTKNTQTKKEAKPIKFIEYTEGILDNKNIIGVDETGVGDYLTPLVACAAFVESTNIDKIKKLGITDSKLMTDKKILEVFPKLKELLKFKVSHLTQQGYNNLNKYMNANELKMFLHIKSINHLELREKVSSDMTIIDQFSNESSIVKYYTSLVEGKLTAESFVKPVMLLEKAESKHISVAAASVIARYYFLKMMEEQDEELEMKTPLGTNETVEQFAIKFVEMHGRKALYSLAKISFKTTEKIDKILAEKQK
ncbi:MAG: ribonuclease HIII [Metamycoplasmataceae bacterium]